MCAIASTCVAKGCADFGLVGVESEKFVVKILACHTVVFFLASKVRHSKPFNKMFLWLFLRGDENSFLVADCQAVMMCALCATPKVFSLFQDSFLLR